MADTKFILPGPDTVTLSSETVGKLLRAGDGDAALLYLFILKTHGQSTPDDAGKALCKGAGSIATSMAVLSRLGLIKLDNDNHTPLPDDETDGPRRYTVDEIKLEMAENASFPTLVEEAQNRLGKKLSSEDLEQLLRIHKELGLPAEVIMLLITHCISESRVRGIGRMPPMSYVEKAAYTWEREKIFTLDRAETYLRDLEKLRVSREKMKEALQISGRNLSSAEKNYVDSWIGMGFDSDAVEIAYDRMMPQTGILNWKYIDSIMNSWHNMGIHSVKEIMEKDARKSGSELRKNSAYDSRFASPDSSTIKRMERLLQKIKEE